MNNKDKLKLALDYSLTDLLLKNGYVRKNESSTKVWFSSPFRNENKPSFIVFKSDGNWFDYGEGEGGDIIDFVKKYHNVSFNEALDIILEGNLRIKVKDYNPPPQKEYFLIKDVKKVAEVNLIKYFCIDRKIDLGLLRLYCKELDVVFPNSKKPDEVYKVLGFPNKRGGYEARNKWLKTTLTPSYFSHIDGNSDISCFEGFMDFLSYLMLVKQDGLDSSVIVFNGNGNWLYTEQLLREASKVLMFLDNDVAGDKVLEKIRSEGVKFKDKRFLYRNYNDLNDKLCGQEKSSVKKKKKLFLERIQKTRIY